jgi:hypothetical protein
VNFTKKNIFSTKDWKDPSESHIPPKDCYLEYEKKSQIVLNSKISPNNPIRKWAKRPRTSLFMEIHTPMSDVCVRCTRTMECYSVRKRNDYCSMQQPDQSTEKNASEKSLSKRSLTT